MNPKVINSMNARLARLEALLENSDVFKAEGGVTYGGLQYEGSTFNIGQQLADNYGFGPNDMVIAELQQRISELELLVAGGSNDTNQSGALDAGTAIGDDGETGSGLPPAPTAEDTAAELGLGTMAYQEASAVAIAGGTATLSSATITSATINGGTITGITDLAVADGGTGASTAANARTNLGLGTIATQASSLVTITGGAIDGTTIGSSTPAAATVTALTLKDAGGDTQLAVTTSSSGCEFSLRDGGGTERGAIRVASATLVNVIADTDLTLYGNSGNIRLSTPSIGFFTTSGGNSKQTVTGSRGGNAALASLLTALASYGLITDSSS